MNSKRVGIIGGSGFYGLDIFRFKEKIRISTPFGEPSDALVLLSIGNREVIFLPRHGHGHFFLPSEINYRANIWAMKKLGVEWIISISAVGSLKKEIQPSDIVLVDQFFDRTSQRKNTFFGEGIVAHVAFHNPVCNELRRLLYEAGQEEGVGSRLHWGGTYLNIEGPCFSTKAESLLHKSFGFDVVGMTNLPEARLAREAEICYATMALVTDYDAWVDEDDVNRVSTERVLENFRKNIEVVKRILGRAIPLIPEERTCACQEALKNAILTKPHAIPRTTFEKLELIIGKYISLETE